MNNYWSFFSRSYTPTITPDMSSPSSTESAVDSQPVNQGRNVTASYMDLERKRARDRKAQQAMRDRNKWTIQNLSHQVDYLSRSLEASATGAHQLELRVETLERDNAQLESHNAALRHEIASIKQVDSELPYPQMLLATNSFEQWQLPPNNNPPSCLADEIIQSFVASKRQSRRSELLADATTTPRAKVFATKPEFTSLVDETQQSQDEISNIVGGIVRSYTEIENLPNKVGVFNMMALLIKWLILLDEESWNMLPIWLRPSMLQLQIPHASWIDRIPWPRARDYLVQHPQISLDDFAASYSSCLTIRWKYDPSHVLMPMTIQVMANPIYEEHIRHLKNWTVGDAFRVRFPELAGLIDDDTKTAMYSPGYDSS